MARSGNLRRGLENVKFMLEQTITELGMETLKNYVDRVIREDDERLKECKHQSLKNS